jgi:hypothetical protein
MKLGDLFVQIYNASMVVGWGWVLFTTVLLLLQGQVAVFEAVRGPLIFLQVWMYLDVTLIQVVNPLLGLAHGSPAASFFQVSARAFNAVFVQSLVPQ